jgi:hypothetical protein
MKAKYTQTELKKMFIKAFSDKIVDLLVGICMNECGADNTRTLGMLECDKEFIATWLEKYADRFVRLYPAEVERMMDKKQANVSLMDRVKLQVDRKSIGMPIATGPFKVTSDVTGTTAATIVMDAPGISGEK